MVLSAKNLNKKRIKKQKKRNTRKVVKQNGAYRHSSSRTVDLTFEYNKSIKRVLAIVSPDAKNIHWPKLTNEAHETYLNHLKQTLPDDVRVRGVADCGYFEWEELSLFEGTHAELSKQKASYRDELFISEAKDIESKKQGIMVQVTRSSDNRVFDIPLKDLEPIDISNTASNLIWDYALWHDHDS